MEKRRRDPERRLMIRRLILISVAAAFVLAAALFSYFIPFRSLLSGLSIPARKDGEVRLHFVDVGQGDCTIVEFPEGDCLVVDAGDGSFEHTEHLIRYIKGLGASALTLVATHADIDHCGGMKNLMETFQVDKLYLPVLASENKVYLDMLATANKRGIEQEVLSRYGVISRPSGAYAVCISPYSIDETSDNDSSAVLYFKYGSVSAFLGGDITAARERRLMREYAVDETIFDSAGYRVRLNEVDILRVSHHGSAYSSSAEWLALLDAEVAVISSGRGNSYAHPAAESVARLAEYVDELYRIDEFGDIMIITDGTQYNVLTDYTE